MPQDEGNPRHEATALDLPDWVSSAEEAAQACSDCLSHKASIVVLCRDDAERPERRNLVSVSYIKRRSRRGFIRLADGTTGREPEFYPELVSRFCVADGFAPIEPWTSTKGNPAGFDMTLVEGNACG
ncbi:MAG: hypothetical protein AAFY81_08440 [Pseudomonadota bacterium]